MKQNHVITFEPCISEAQTLVSRLQQRIHQQRHQRLIDVFTALADDDRSVGILAYYIWRRRLRRQT